jgi:hypothetical protein
MDRCGEDYAFGFEYGVLGMGEQLIEVFNEVFLF